MILKARLLPACLLAALAFLAVHATTAHAGFGIANFEAGTCVNNSCTYESIEANPGAAFTQAAGHPPWGITTFELSHKSNGEPEGAPLKRVRVDVPPGLAADPEALPQCPLSTFELGGCPSDTKVGTTEMEVFVLLTKLKISGNVYDLPPQEGLPLLFGIEINAESPIISPVKIYLEGHLAWSSDYHEYFEINNIPPEVETLGGLKSPLETLKSKLNFNGQAGQGNFLTLPSVCSASTESHLEVESYAHEKARRPTTTPVGVEGCAAVPFTPSASVVAGTPAYDQPDGATVVVKVPQNTHSINDADLREAHVTMPEGLTLNPSAAHGLAVCTPTQIAIGSAASVSCPAASRVGTVTIETDLPPGSLTGGVYLGDPSGGPITGPPFTIYFDAESIYGVSVRLKGLVNANPSTGRLETSFTENPPLPFSALLLTLNGGPRAPLANPLSCAKAAMESVFTPYTEPSAWDSSTPFASTGCPASIPFSWTQSTSASPSGAGAFGSTSYTFNLARQDGQQELQHLSVELPPGVVGQIPSVPLCGEPQAAQGTCPATSQIGAAVVSAGAGSEPYAFSGPVYLTGPYGGSPYGLSIPVAAVAGPFNFGSVVTRAGVGVEPYSGRVVVSTSLPTIVRGVPLRLKTLSVTVNRHNFLYNPTSCAALSTESSLTSVLGAIGAASSSFQLGGCGALSFTPTLGASTTAKISKVGGASLDVSIEQGAHQANIHSVTTELPSEFSVRDTTLHLACLQATFAANPLGCAGATVGSATATTPVLPGTLRGPAILVSHGGAAFPDLDVVLEGDGVRVILVGNTKITRAGILTTTFASLPDVPIGSFSLTLPTGPHSLLAIPTAKPCAQPLTMPTIIVAQNGTQLHQQTPIAVEECGAAGAEGVTGRHRLFRILSTRRAGNDILVRVRTFLAGRLSAGGKYLKGASRKLHRAATVTLKLPINHKGFAAMSAHRKLKVKVRVTLKPARRGLHSASATASIKIRR